MPPQVVTVSARGEELRDLLPAGDRVILGISGSPGSGKSTLAAFLAKARGGVVVPMDGFHLADEELTRRGILDRKGAPETFDSWGYANLLTRIAGRRQHVVMAPRFDRGLEEAVAGSIPVPPEASFVVTEGNYLLLKADPWPEVRSHLDQVWHVVVDPELRRHRLQLRHEKFGKSPSEAREWIARVDEPNAALVEQGTSRADLVLDLTQWRR